MQLIACQCLTCHRRYDVMADPRVMGDATRRGEWPFCPGCGCLAIHGPGDVIVPSLQPLD
jgi:hypothetical protein